MQLLRKLAFPLSLLYALVIFLRNRFYDYGWFTSATFETPVVCVGNLSLGGTGKTPMTEWIISRLSTSRKLAVLSRGYRRKTLGFRIVSSNSSAIECGDEPLQMALKFPEITVAVDGNRTRGIRRLEKEYAPILYCWMMPSSTVRLNRSTPFCLRHMGIYTAMTGICLPGTYVIIGVRHAGHRQ